LREQLSVSNKIQWKLYEVPNLYFLLIVLSQSPNSKTVVARTQYENGLIIPRMTQALKVECQAWNSWNPSLSRKTKTTLE
jgi:hypothetical protein